ncbi:MAG: beta-galactosidase trimerization domain-containing protein [Phycisphaerae bacterium]
MHSSMRFRQIHLDFHTSGHIPGVGADFDPERYARRLKDAHVDSITTFARCHHGHIYYDTKRHPERIHPTLANRNLLAEQIAACHALDIRVPVYTTVQWDAFTADAHRDWLCVDPDGKLLSYEPLGPGFYQFLDVFHPGYRQFLKEHVTDMFQSLGELDGLFFDIVQPRDSVAPHWIAAMDEAGLDPEDGRQRSLFARTVIRDWQSEMTAHVRSFSKDCTVFYNAGHVGTRHRDGHEAFTHWELESLPSGGWGYSHFPQSMRYARTLAGLPCLGMTGKFHTSWGDFHSYKSKPALEFECLHMLALGARCSVGDQLHPRGELDKPTYDLIGSVYQSVEAKEPWVEGSKPVVEAALLTPEEFVSSKPAFAAKSDRDVPSVVGAMRMLTELGIQFDIVDTAADLSAYKLLVLPDEIPGTPEVAKLVAAFVKGGGKVIASHNSGLLDDRFTLPELGVSYVGPAPFSPDFVVANEHIGRNLPNAPHVIYEQAAEVKPESGTTVLARVQVPYFNRTWRHYCSHRHTPSSLQEAYPAAVRNGGVIYFAHPLFTQYFDNAPAWCKAFVADAIDTLLETRLLRHNGPTGLIAALNHQPASARHVLHLLFYIPERRGQAFDVIEDVIPLHDITVSLATPANAKSVRLVPDMQDVPFETRDGRLVIRVPKIMGHAMLEIS